MCNLQNKSKIIYIKQISGRKNNFINYKLFKNQKIDKTKYVKQASSQKKNNMRAIK